MALGPDRDDVLFQIDGKPYRMGASVLVYAYDKDIGQWVTLIQQRGNVSDIGAQNQYANSGGGLLNRVRDGISDADLTKISVADENGRLVSGALDPVMFAKGAVGEFGQEIETGDGVPVLKQGIDPQRLIKLSQGIDPPTVEQVAKLPPNWTPTIYMTFAVKLTAEEYKKLKATFGINNFAVDTQGGKKPQHHVSGSGGYNRKGEVAQASFVPIATILSPAWQETHPHKYPHELSAIERLADTLPNTADLPTRFAATRRFARRFAELFKLGRS